MTALAGLLTVRSTPLQDREIQIILVENVNYSKTHVSLANNYVITNIIVLPSLIGHQYAKFAPWYENCHDIEC